METDRRIRVAHVLKSSIYSGAENVVFTIIKYLQERYEFVYIATDGPIRERLEQEGIPHMLLETFSRRNLAKAIRAFRPDIVHAHDFSATVLCAVLPGRFRLISHLHYDPPWSRRWNGKTIGYLVSSVKVRRILAVSENAFHNLVFSKILENKHLAMGNPIDIQRILALSDEHLLDENETCDLIFVGRFVEQKDPQRFIRLIAQLKKAGWMNIKAWMLGQGEQAESCMSMIKDLNLEDNIEWKGFQDNPYVYMKRAKLFCVTSRWEGFGLVVAEANLLNVPVVSTDNAGSAEILGKNAPEICRTDQEFVDKILTLKNNQHIYENWKMRTQKRVLNFKEINTYMEELERIYRNEVMKW